MNRTMWALGIICWLLLVIFLWNEAGCSVATPC